MLGSISLPVTGDDPFSTDNSLTEVRRAGLVHHGDGDRRGRQHLRVLEVPARRGPDAAARSPSTRRRRRRTRPCSDGDCSLGDAINVANVTPCTGCGHDRLRHPGTAAVGDLADDSAGAHHPRRGDRRDDAAGLRGHAGRPARRLRLRRSGNGPRRSTGRSERQHDPRPLDHEIPRCGHQPPGSAVRVVEGNYLGLAPDGTAAGNGAAASATPESSWTRTATASAERRRRAQRHLREQRRQASSSAATASGTSSLGNRIGTNPAGRRAGAEHGNGIHYEDARAQIIGGTATGAGNLISGNGGNGIDVNSGFAIDGDPPSGSRGTHRARRRRRDRRCRTAGPACSSTASTTGRAASAARPREPAT